MNAVAHPVVSVESLEAGKIEVAAFDHAAHIYLGWLYLNQYPLPDAITHFACALRRLTEKLGIPGKYHETITWFFLALIAERRDRMDADDWFSFCRANPDLFYRGDENIVNRYYSPELLARDHARQTFVLPDRLPA